MAKLPISPVLLSKRCHSVAAESSRLPQAASVVRKATMTESASGNVVSAKEEKAFWMKDPETGNWIPEDHFGEVDPADQREKFLPKKTKKFETNLRSD